MSAATMDGIFSDEVFTATELNRRAGMVLDHASIHPVTISRNNEQFALIRREQAASMVRTLAQVKRALSVLSAANSAVMGEPVSAAFSWLNVFEKDDIQKLISEVFGVVGRAMAGIGEWYEAEALIHEWRESALVVTTGVLDHAMYADTSDESVLMHPDQIFADNEADLAL